jgi:alkylation response protein AidB-like acyl-CoA dehydrogenase
MDFELSQDQKEAYADALRFAKAELQGDVVARDRDHVFPEDLWKKCGARRIPGLPVPEALGGRGLDPLSSTLVLEALGHGCTDAGLCFSLGAHLATASVPLWKFGTLEQQARYLRGLCDGSIVGVGALSEPGAGSDAAAISTTARPDGNGFVLAGTKRYISDAAIADVIVLYAMTDRQKGFHGGMTAFLVDTDQPGFQVTRTFSMMGLRTAPIGEIVLDDVRVSADAVLGGVGGGATVFQTAMDWERVFLMAGQIGAMQRLLDRSVQHARTRKQFGQAIGKFQAVAHRLVDLKVNIEAARLLVYRAATRLDKSKAVSLDAAMAKLFASEAAVETALDAIRTHGASGYVVDNELERALRDAVGSTIYSGTSDIQRNIIARWLGL